MKKKYTLVYTEYVGFGRGTKVTKYKHIVTDDLAQYIKSMEAWAADVVFVFDGVCEESKS